MKHSKNRPSHHGFPTLFAILISASTISISYAQTSAKHAHGINPQNRSPVDLVLSQDEKWLLTANQTSNSVSLINRKTGKVVSEVPVGHRPSAIALTPDGDTALVSGTYSGDLTFLTFKNGKLKKSGRMFFNYFQPRGVTVSSDGKRAYVALTTAHKIAVVDIEKQKVVGQINAGRWPRYLSLSPDDKRLAIGANGDGGVSVVDLEKRKLLFQEKFGALNMGQMQITSNGKHVYFPWMVYRSNPISQINIEFGWVMANRIARVNINKHTRREAIAIDTLGNASADPHGLAFSPNEEWMVCSASGAHELLVFRVKGSPFMDYAGPGDSLHPDLREDKNRFYRIPLGGRPMFVRYSKDGRHVYVANYLLNAVQVVHVPAKKIVRTIHLGGPRQPSLARKGEAIFYDGFRTLDHWYSCHSCHYEGHTNAVPMDTLSDKTIFSLKSVLSLRNVTKTAPWTWHGSQSSLHDTIRNSMTTTLHAKDPAKGDIEALVAFLDTLKPPPNPHRAADGSLSAAAKRGELIFKGKKANCIRCHQGPYFTSEKNYNVGLGSDYDHFPTYNPPSLIGVYDRIIYLHDGRPITLEDLLRGPHSPARVTGNGDLTDEELNDLISYVKSL